MSFHLTVTNEQGEVCIDMECDAIIGGVLPKGETDGATAVCFVEAPDSDSVIHTLMSAEYGRKELLNAKPWLKKLWRWRRLIYPLIACDEVERGER